MAQAYYDAPIPVDNRAHEGPIPIDSDPYLATFGGQKVVVPAHAQENPWPTLTPDGVPPTLPPPSTATAGTICGLRRRTFYIILTVAAVLLISAVAGLAGGLVSQRNQANNADSTDAVVPGPESSGNSSATSPASSSSPSAPSSSPGPLLASPMLDNSQIAASGFGNASVTVSYVAYQDPVGSLMLAAWDSHNVTWRAVNISDRMLTSGNPVRARLGTPLAIATSFAAHVVVIFLNEDNIIRAVHTENDGYYMAWKHSGLYGPGQSSISAQPESRLATYWLWCIKCTESEDGQGKVRLFLESSEPGVLQSYLDKTEDSNFSGTRGRAGSGLAVTSLRDASRESWLVPFFDTGEKLGMMTRKSDTDSDWVLHEAFSGATHPTFPGQQIVAGTFEVDYANGTQMAEMVTLAVQLEKDGSLAVSWWDPRTQTWTFGSPVELREGPQPPPAFSAIAMMNSKFYGMADGSVLEYGVDKATVNRFVFTGKPVTR